MMKGVLRAWLLSVVFTIFLLGADARAQQVSLSADELNHLGVTAQSLAQLKTVNETVSKAAGAAPGLVMEKVLFTNAGGNRFLWRVDFSGNFPKDNSNIIFYIDTDHDNKTGRRNFSGIDVMIWVANGATRTAGYTPEGSIVSGPVAFAVIRDNSLFVSVDMDLHQQENATVVPVSVLAQTNQPLKTQSTVPFFELRGAPFSEEEKVQRVERHGQNENVVSTWGLEELRRIHKDEANIVLPILQAKLTGWTLDLNSAYRESSAILPTGSGRGTIQAQVPQAGLYHPAFIFYDNAAKQAISISVNGREQGVAVAADGDNNQKLFALARPLELKKGDLIELHNLNGNGIYRTEDLLLLKNLFPQKSSQYAFNHVAATRPWQQGDAMRVTFTTTWPAQTRVQYGTTESLGSEIVEKTAPLNNHRLYLRGLKEGVKYFYRLSALDRSGKTVQSPIKNFVFQKPAYPSAIAATKTVPLKLSQLPPGAAWPVSSGVPLPQGEVFQTANLRLVNASQQALAAEKKVLARWQDGSIKWVLLSFLAAPAQIEYQLQYGAQIRDESSGLLALHESDGGIIVDTGALKWSAMRRPSGTFQLSLAQNGKELLGDGRLVLTDASGKTFSSDFKPDEVTIEDNGAHHAVILLRGSLGNGGDGSTLFRYVVRWKFTRNSPLARVLITLENDQTNTVFSEVKSAVLRFNLPSATAQIRLGDVGQFASAPNRPTGVLQHFDNVFTAQTPQGEKSGERFPGWMGWKSGAQNLTLAVRDFWQLYPKAFTVRGDVLEIGLAPPVDAKLYERFKGTVEEYRSVYYLMNGNYRLRQGVSFTTEVVLNAAPQADGAQLAEYANEQPILVATPEYYRDSKAFGDIGLGNEFPLVQRYNEKTAGAFESYIAARDKQHEYGLMNYGDWWGERGINWGNVEYDTQHAFILQFARTGDVSFLRAGADAAIHNRDIDTMHFESSPAMAHRDGRVWIHSIGHTGGYFKESPLKGQGLPESHFTSSHTWTEGHYEYYFLTGDTRSLRTANRITDIYGSDNTRNYDFSAGREPGWHLIFTMGAYDATGDPFYLNAARIIVERVLERQTPNGGWDRQLPPGHCSHLPRHHGEAGFMVGVLMTGLKNYAEVTGDQRAKDSVVKAAHFMINDMWIPEAKAFRYTSCPGTGPAPGLNLLICEGIAYAWRQTRDPQLRRVSLDAMELIVEQMDGGGKNISMELRSTPRQLFDVIEMLKIQDPLVIQAQAKTPRAGEGNSVQFSATAKTLKGNIEKYSWDFGDGTNGEGQQVTHTYPNGGNYAVSAKVRNSIGEEASEFLNISVPPPFLQKLDKLTTVALQAEDFSAQDSGEVSIVRGRVGAWDKAITNWESYPGHWLEWKFEIPSDGEYQLILKYASGSTEAQRAVQIDGKYPDPALQRVVFPGTGGFSGGEDNWQLKSLQIPLLKGTHTLRISNLGGGMALDFLLIQKPTPN